MSRTFAELVNYLAENGDAAFRGEFQFGVIVLMSDLTPAEPGLFATRHASDHELLARQRAALKATPNRGLVFPIRKRADGVFVDKIGIGRTRNVDITIPSVQISKYHAFFSVDERGAGYALTDVGSKNGTLVDGGRLEPRAPHPLRSGSVVAFGGVEFTFYDTDGLYRACAARLGPASGR
jgi:hypothetical protein